MSARKKKRKGFDPDKVPRILRNRYFIVSFFFFFWILLFDKNRIITQIQLQRALNEKETELQYYKDKIQEVGEEREALFTDKEALEKYARERYKFKKTNEDVFIIEKEE